MTLTIFAGNIEQLSFPVQNIPGGVSITNATFTLKRFLTDPDPGVVQKTLGQGITIAGTQVYVTLQEPDLDWVGLNDRGFFYDLQITLSDSTGPYTAALGRIRARLRVTQTP